MVELIEIWYGPPKPYGGELNKVGDAYLEVQTAYPNCRRNTEHCGVTVVEFTCDPIEYVEIGGRAYEIERKYGKKARVSIHRDESVEFIPPISGPTKQRIMLIAKAGEFPALYYEVN